MATIEYVDIHRNERYSQQLTENLNCLFMNNELTDFTIHCGRVSIRCHRLIIASNSPVLRSMLRSEMTESSKNQVRLDQFSPEVVEAIVGYMYTGHLRMKTRHLMGLIQATHYLQMEDILDRLTGNVQSCLSANNVISWYRIAEKLELKEVKTTSFNLMFSDFTNIALGKEFLDLGASDIKEYMSSARQKWVASDEVLQAILTWLDEDPDDRCEVMNDLIRLVRIQQCSFNYLQSVTKDYAHLLDKNPVVYKLLFAGAIHTGSHEDSSNMLIAGGNRDLEENRQCSVFDVQRKEFLEETKIPLGASAHWSSICKVPGGFVVTGGVGKRSCVMYVTRTQSWKTLRSMLSIRSCHGSTCVNGLLFVVGGCCYDTIVSETSKSVFNLFRSKTPDVDRTAAVSMEVYDMASEIWEVGLPLPSPSPYPKVFSYNNGLYTLCPAQKQLYHMDIRARTKTWTTIQAPVPETVSWSSSVAVAGDRIFVAGGDMNMCAWYNPALNSWSIGKQNAKPHHFGALLYHNGSMLLLGGKTEFTEEYNMKKDEWITSAIKVPAQLWNHAVVHSDV